MMGVRVHAEEEAAERAGEQPPRAPSHREPAVELTVASQGSGAASARGRGAGSAQDPLGRAPPAAEAALAADDAAAEAPWTPSDPELRDGQVSILSLRDPPARVHRVPAAEAGGGPAYRVLPRLAPTDWTLADEKGGREEQKGGTERGAAGAAAQDKGSFATVRARSGAAKRVYFVARA